MQLSKRIYWTLSEARRSLQKSAPDLRSLHVEITDRCNLQCRHCYMSSVCGGKDAISAAEWCDFFDRVRDDFGPDVAVQISGGEALIRKDIFDILTHLHSLGFGLSLVSNGILLDRPTAARLVETVPAISVSLDGFRDSHDYLRGAAVFDRVSENVRRLKGIGFKKVTLKTAVFRRNLDALPEFRDYVRQIGVDKWHVFAMEPIGRGRLNRADMLDIDGYLKLCEYADEWRTDRNLGMEFAFGEGLPKFVCERACESCRYHRCDAGITFCGVLHNGDIVSCIQDDRSSQPVYGNILTDSLKKVWTERFERNRQKDYDYCDNHHYLNNLLQKL